jgi:predicted AAA+ superfamily ATPase
MKDVLKRIISEFHERDIDYINRDISMNFPKNKIITIIGPRRSGKTYFMFQIMDFFISKGFKRSQFLYINFEDERFVRSDFDYDLIFQSFFDLFPENADSEIVVFFDEIQLLPNWDKFIRRVYDSVSHNIFVTGSNSNMLSSDISSSLRGRNYNIEVFPLSFSEFLNFRDIKPVLSTNKNISIINNAFDEYLIYGGYPEIVKYDDVMKIEILQNYFNVMIYRDISERFDISQTNILKFVLKKLISSVSSEFSINKLYNEIKSFGGKISKDTLYSLMENISNIFLLKEVERYSNSLSQRKGYNSKYYFYDNGILSAINYNISKDFGKLMENLVAIELLRRNYEIYYSKNNFECDFIALKRNSSLSVQVCYNLTEDNIGREIKGLNDKKTHDNILIYYKSEIRPPENSINIIDFLLKKQIEDR